MYSPSFVEALSSNLIYKLAIIPNCLIYETKNILVPQIWRWKTERESRLMGVK